MVSQRSLTNTLASDAMRGLGRALRAAPKPRIKGCDIGGGTKGCRTEARVLQHLAFVMFLYDEWILVLKRPACPSDPHVSSAAATRYSHAPVMRKRTDLQCAKSAMQHCHL